MKRISLIAVLSLIGYQVVSQSQGPYDPASASYSAFGCLACPGSEWQSLINISQPDHQFVKATLQPFPTCFQTTCCYSRILFATGFGFSIPAGSVVTGIEATVMRESTSSAGVEDSSVTLYTGNPVGVNHASSVPWTLVSATVTYGDSTDTWGYTLTPDSVNSQDFGLGILVINKNLSTVPATPCVDHVTMTVYYSTGTGIYSQTRSPGPFRISYNPLYGVLNIFCAEEAFGAIQLFDAEGKQIFESEEVVLQPGNNSFPVTLRPGIFFVSISSRSSTLRRKFIAVNP